MAGGWGIAMTTQAHFVLFWNVTNTFMELTDFQ